MIVEQLIFIIIAFGLFVYMFYRLIKENDTGYVPILAIQALGIAIKFIEVVFGEDEPNIFIQIITYCLSIILPLAIIILEKMNASFFEAYFSHYLTIAILTLKGNT